MVPDAQVTGEILAGRYRVERELGRGGTAMVYLAQDLKHNRKVALKILNPRLAAILGSDRFLREIEIVAQLNHPHVLPLHDSGQTGTLLYYVMPYIEGESLRDQLQRRGRLPVGDVLRLTREIADGLGYAHRLGIVHRDIKPENILLSEGHAVVADFGIAQALSVASASRLTDVGIAVGTPVYMSPEQARGEGEITARTDVYGLACVVYEMLAGEPPFTGPNVETVLAQKSVGRVPSLRQVSGTFPPAIDDALTRALAPKPTDRFETPVELAEALARAWERRMRVARQWRSWAAVAAVVAAAVIVARLLPGRDADNAGEPVAGLSAAGVRVGVLPPDVLGASADSANRSGALVQYLLAAELTRYRGLAVVDPLSLNSRFQATDPASADPIQTLRDWGLDYVVRTTLTPQDSGIRVSYALTSTRQGEVISTGSFIAVGETDLPARIRIAADSLRSALDVASGGIAKAVDLEPFLTREPKPEAVSAFLRGTEYSYRALPGGGAHFEQALDLDPDFIAPRVWLVSGLIEAGDTAAARRHVEVLQSLAPKATPFEQALIGWADGKVRNDLEATVSHLQVALSYSPRNNILLYSLGYSLFELGRARDAVAPVREAMESGWRFSKLSTLWGVVAIETGQTDSLYPMLLEARTIIPADPYLNGLLEALALYQGDTAAATRHLAAFREDLGPLGSDLLARKLSEMARIYWALARKARAESRPDRAVLLLKRAVEVLPSAPELHLELARALAEAGRRDEAERHYSAVARDTTAGSAMSVFLSGEVAALLGRDSEARRWFERYLERWPDGAEAATARARLQSGGRTGSP